MVLLMIHLLFLYFLFGDYQPCESNVFTPFETIQIYVELVGITERPIGNIMEENTQYLTNTTGNFTITDKQGRNVK
jgi:hypothetical protein